MRIETERLSIRDATEDDIEFLAAIQTNEVVQMHVGGVLDTFENTVAHIRKHPENLSDFYVISIRPEGFSIGVVAFVPNRYLGKREILIELMPDHFGKGYGPETLSAIRDWWLETNGADYMYATARPENLASISMLKKAQFQLVNEYEELFKPRQFVFKYERANP
ncbi:GNAT family N-acetyltransferase [Nitrosomonas sp. Is37]|uniref:GNAT family N-acetyltransferase n=1 Tax=Nitrosomonas sp. Is37 TaxID=3080535 RepID=UPI00294B78D8|nr:GNAT family N-acetyltransferase [Nitrosomonas sp. Is37]MDV6343269.1 GNAT family N-acetyltransferase [Nitrosomonas sp. Is37]